MKSSIVYRVDLKFYWNRHWLSASHAGLGPPAESAESAERFLYRAHRLELHSSRRTAWAQLNQLSSLFPSLPSLHFSSLIFYSFPPSLPFPTFSYFPSLPSSYAYLRLKKVYLPLWLLLQPNPPCSQYILFPLSSANPIFANFQSPSQKFSILENFPQHSSVFGLVSRKNLKFFSQWRYFSLPFSKPFLT